MYFLFCLSKTTFFTLSQHRNPAFTPSEVITMKNRVPVELQHASSSLFPWWLQNRVFAVYERWKGDWEHKGGRSVGNFSWSSPLPSQRSSLTQLRAVKEEIYIPMHEYHKQSECNSRLGVVKWGRALQNRMMEMFQAHGRKHVHWWSQFRKINKWHTNAVLESQSKGAQVKDLVLKKPQPPWISPNRSEIVCIVCIIFSAHTFQKQWRTWEPKKCWGTNKILKL